MLETAKLESYKLTDSLDLLGISKSSDSQKSAGRDPLQHFPSAMKKYPPTITPFFH